MNITGGYLNSRKIKTNKSDNVRPTLSKTRQAVFSSLLSFLGEFNEKSFLDLFAGSAIISFEAISRGFKTVYTVEQDRKTAKIIKDNFEDLKLKPNMTISDAVKFLKTTDKKFDVIFLDPPYDSDLYDKSLKVIKDRNLLKTNGIIILEHKSDKNIDTESFEIVKTKDYSDIRITFLANKTP